MGPKPDNHTNLLRKPDTGSVRPDGREAVVGVWPRTGLGARPDADRRRSGARNHVVVVGPVVVVVVVVDVDGGGCGVLVGFGGIVQLMGGQISTTNSKSLTNTVTYRRTKEETCFLKNN